jgi:ABC-type Zn uptake system ZnuABC Zn-binding protein ZnuA
VLLAAALPARAPAQARLKVLATLPDLWAITRALVGDLGDVQVATRPGQNPHDLEIRPSQILLVKRAEILVRNGLDEDPWIDPVIESSGNPRLLRGAPSVVEAVRGGTY